MTASPAHHLPEVVLRPVRGHHAFEACVEQLARAIRLGVYPVGSTLPPERELAARLTVSRATLREAMAALRQAGLVETTRGRGGGTVVTRQARSPYARRAARITPAQRRLLVALCRPPRESRHNAPASTRELAAELMISLDTVKGTLSTLFELFGLTGLPQIQQRTVLALQALTLLGGEH